MSGSYGFSVNLELKPNSEFTFDEVREFIEENGGNNESQILQSILLEDEQGLIVFFGDNEDTWRYDYSQEMIELLKKLEDQYGGKFKGELIWFEYGLHSDTVMEYEFDGEGGVKFTLKDEPVDEDDWADEEEDDEDE
jgi:hypothetical protein